MRMIRLARWSVGISLAALAATLACSKDHGPGPTGPNPSPLPLPSSLTLAPVASGFDNPVFLTAPPGDRDRMFVVEQSGAIKIVKGGVTLSTPFLTVGGLSTGYEQGLLSLAFDPRYSTNGRFYVF